MSRGKSSSKRLAVAGFTHGSYLYVVVPVLQELDRLLQHCLQDPATNALNLWAKPHDPSPSPPKKVYTQHYATLHTQSYTTPYDPTHPLRPKPFEDSPV